MWDRNPRWRSLTGAIRFPKTSSEVEAIIKSQGVWLVKTHECPSQLACSTAPAIYILRDGRETCVSYWKFLQDLCGVTFVSLEDVIRGRVPFGDWGWHLEAWNPRQRPNTLLLRYEDMVEDLPVVISRVAEVLHVEPRQTHIASWSEFHNCDPLFFRAGTNETWRELMTDGDLALFDKLHGPTMREYGYTKGVGHATSAA